MNELRRILVELWAERARVGLVSMGVLWGTLSLTLLLALGRSMVEATSSTADGFGVGLLSISGGATSLPFAGLPAGRPIRLRPADAEALGRLRGVRATCYEYSWGGGLSVRVGDVRRNVALAGVSPGFGQLRRHAARPGGRFLNQPDFDQHRRVCFLGSRIARRLFGEQEPVGRTLELAGTPLLVVGVSPPKISFSSYNGEDRDKLTLPATTFQDLVGWRWISRAWVGVVPGADPLRVLADVRRTLGSRLRFDRKDDAALDVPDYTGIRAMIDSILNGTSVFTLVVGVLGLLVAVVGVTNVMLALVEERTAELGVMLALGARPIRLAQERLVEGVLVTAAGGLAGLLLCAGLLAGLGAIEVPPEVTGYLGHPRLDPGLGAAVLAVLVVLGALAGWVPARRAMGLDPAQVLREE
jgi:putative ABC transport system permease protein